MGEVETKPVARAPISAIEVAKVVSAFPFTKEAAQSIVAKLDPERVPEIAVRLKELEDFLKTVRTEAEAAMVTAALKGWIDPWTHDTYTFEGALGDAQIDDPDALAEELEESLKADGLTFSDARDVIEAMLPLVRKPAFEEVNKFLKRDPNTDAPIYPATFAAIRARHSRKKPGPPHLTKKK